MYPSPLSSGKRDTGRRGRLYFSYMYGSSHTTGQESNFPSFKVQKDRWKVKWANDRLDWYFPAQISSVWSTWSAQVSNQFALDCVSRKCRVRRLLCVSPSAVFAVPGGLLTGTFRAWRSLWVRPEHQYLTCLNASLVRPVALRHYWAKLPPSDVKGHSGASSKLT